MFSCWILLVTSFFSKGTVDDHAVAKRNIRQTAVKYGYINVYASVLVKRADKQIADNKALV